MKLSSQNWLIRYAYSPDWFLHDKDRGPYEPPVRTNLCRLFWRTLFIPPIFWLIFIPACIIMSPCFLLAYLVEVKLPKTKIRNKIKSLATESLVATAIRDFKNKTCTIIEIESSSVD